MDENFETFIVHVASFYWGIHSDREALIAFLLMEEVKILEEYPDFTSVFSEEKTLVLLERIELNGHSINLEDSKQLPYRLIYSLGPINLETLKTYTKTLKTTISSSKSRLPPVAFFDPHLLVDTGQIQLGESFCSTSSVK